MLILTSLAGDLAAWFAAIGTVGTLLWLVFEHLKRQEDVRTEKLRAQASKIAYWAEVRPDGGLEFVVRNAGDLPAYGALIVSRDTILASARNLVTGTLPPGETRRRVPDEDVEAVDLDKLGLALNHDPGLISSSLSFTDAEGVKWVRDASGALAEGSVKLSKLDARVVQGLYDLSDDGEQAAELVSIARQARIFKHLVAARLNHLRHRGLVSVQVAKRGETWWRLTAAGARTARARQDGGAD